MRPPTATLQPRLAMTAMTALTNGPMKPPQTPQCSRCEPCHCTKLRHNQDWDCDGETECLKL